MLTKCSDGYGDSPSKSLPSGERQGDKIGRLQQASSALEDAFSKPGAAASVGTDTCCAESSQGHKANVALE